EGNGEFDLPKLADQLRRQRLEPLEKHLAGVKRLYVVPASPMAGVPGEAFTRPYAVSYVPSGAFLASLQARPAPPSSGVLALGDPLFSKRDHVSKMAEDVPESGLLLTDVLPGGNAATAGLRPGDVLLKYAGSLVTSLERLDELIKANLNTR